MLKFILGTSCCVYVYGINTNQDYVEWTSDVHLDTNLGFDPDINLPVEKALDLCHSKGYSKESAHLDPSLDASLVNYCNKMHYLELIQHSLQDNINDVSNAAMEMKKICRQSVLDPNENGFQDFFQKYMLHGLSAETSDYVAVSETFLSTCFNLNEPSSPLNNLSEACQEALENFHVPQCVFNDYMQRINTSHVISLPTLYQKPIPQSLSCRFGLHMALVSVGEEPASMHVASRTPSPFEYFVPIFSRDNLNGTGGDTSITLTRGRVLFVPSGDAAFVDTGSVLRFCFVDASNFNRMKQHLRVEALLEDESVRRWLTTVQDTTFDTSMIRRVTASHTSWDAYRTWPRPQKLSKESNADEALSRRERYKVWQEDRKWDSLVQGLTLPVSRPPRIEDSSKDIQRTTVTLTWQDVYQPRKGDITPYSYEVSWQKFGESEFQSKNITELSRSALPTTSFGDAFDGKAIQGLVDGLDPDTTYQFILRLFVGDAVGLHTEKSSQIRTKPCSEPSTIRGQATTNLPAKESPNCIQLSWLPAVDDGGRPIKGYVVSSRYAASKELQWMTYNATNSFDILSNSAVVVSKNEVAHEAESLTGIVCNLRQGVTYQFQVGALNELGVGPYSLWTDPVDIKRVSDGQRTDVLRGVGAPQFHRKYNRASLTSDSIPRSTVGPLLLSDKFQFVQPYRLISIPIKTTETPTWNTWVADVWSGHYSPKAFNVVAEAVLADPIHADGPLVNAEQAQDRLVVIHRGRIPLFNKIWYAQNAGALGVLILDVMDLCAGGFDHHCSPGSNLAFGEGFGAQDDPNVWSQIYIPHVLVRAEDAAVLLAKLSP